MAYSRPSLFLPLASLAAAAALLFLMIKGLCLLLGPWNLLLGIGVLHSIACAFAIKEWRYWWYPEFDGIEIRVREPFKQFGGMDYTAEPDNLGRWAVFSHFFYVHFSAVLLSLELFIHLAMGHDHERAEESGDNILPEGMMAQEMNHGKCQLLYSKAAETAFGYPAGYRILWRFVLFTLFPLPMRQAFIAYLEAGFVVITNLVSKCPSILSMLFGEPRWVWMWHFMEESEHCWDSVPDMMAHCNVGWRFMIWAANWFIMPTLFFPLAIIEGLLYGRKSIARDPLSLPCPLLWHFAFYLPFLFMLQACVGLHIVLGMRPSDAKYHSVKDRMSREIYAKIKEDFNVTHIQKPHQHLEKRKLGKQHFKAAVDTIRMAKRLGAASADGFSAPKAGQPLGIQEASKRLSESSERLGQYRQKLYSKSVEDLMRGGLDAEEIKDTPFDVIMQYVDAGYKAPAPPACADA